MDETVIEGNCGTLCDSHCCRTHAEDGEQMGVYLLPGEFESILKGTELAKTLHIEKHSYREYDISPKVKYLFFFNCGQGDRCLREMRPIQCRTYPFAPHLEGEKLFLVVEKEQVHRCPLLRTPELIRQEFIEGVYQGWQTLLQIPAVRHQVEYDSAERILDDNCRKSPAK